MSMFNLSGRVALVTGSSRGLGLEMAMALGRAGAKVALNYCNNEATAEQALAKFKDAGLEGAMFRADVIDENSVGELHDQISAELGPVDILIPNATPDQPLKAIEDYDWDFYQSMYDFFVKSPFLLTRACLPHMKEQRWGRILNITSEVFVRGTPNFTAYTAAKGGQVGLSRSLASELAPFQITVNTIAPGWIPVERHDNDPQEEKDAYFETIPMGRWGIPADLNGAVVFLCSDASSFVTGQSMTVNGGISIG